MAITRQKMWMIAAAIVLAAGLLAYWHFSRTPFIEPDPITEIKDAYVVLYDDAGFSDRRLTIRYPKTIANFDHVASDNGEVGFGDKSSSVQWQIPAGYKFVLYDDHDYRDTPLELNPNGGKYQTFPDLDAQSFGDKASSGRWVKTDVAPVTRIEDAYVELHDDDGLRGRVKTIRPLVDDTNFDALASDDGQSGFGDKTSSIRWQIPEGYRYTLYDDNGFRSTAVELTSQGGILQTMDSLKARGFNDKASSGRWTRDAPPPVTRIEDAYVELYDDNQFRDRRATIRARTDVPDFNNLASDDGRRGFGDKTSSIRWQIPPGYKFVLYDDNGYRDRALELPAGDGSLQTIDNLDSRDFGDKASSGRWMNLRPAPVTRIEDAYVELYDDKGFADRRAILKPQVDVPDFNRLASDDGQVGFGDKTSSVRWQIPDGYEVVLFDDKNYRDRSIVLAPSGGRLSEISDLNSRDFGDKASSARWVVRSGSYVELFDDADFRDRHLTIQRGQDVRNFNQVNSDDGKRGFNDKASSVRWSIQPGYKFILYQNDGYRGKAVELLPGTGVQSIRDLGARDFNDRASSGRWERLR